MMRSRQKVAMFINVMIVLLEFFAFVVRTISAGSRFSLGGAACFYTVDSNLFALISSVIYVVLGTKATEEKRELPGGLSLLRYMATATVTYTLAIVFFVLIPGIGKGGFSQMIMTPVLFVQHLAAPVLCLISFIGFETEKKLPRRWQLWALLPTLFYALVMYILNMTHTIKGPYPFFEVYRFTWWQNGLIFVILFGLCILVNALILFVANRFSGRDTLMLNAIDRMAEEEEAQKTEEQRQKEAEEREKKRKKNPYLYDIIGLVVKK